MYTVMAPNATYALSHPMKVKIEHGHGACRCHRCLQLILVGQRVVSISRHHRRRASGYRIYHEACFEAMFV
jgi:hypothetical protein